MCGIYRLNTLYMNHFGLGFHLLMRLFLIFFLLCYRSAENRGFGLTLMTLCDYVIGNGIS